MPGIEPASQKQVRWAFASESRGKLRPTPKTPWTSEEAKAQQSIAREWAHRWKCWSWDTKSRGAMPDDCKSALKLLDKIRAENPSWKVPEGVTRAAPAVRLVPPVRAPKPKPAPVRARPAAAIVFNRPKAAPIAARTAKARPTKGRSKSISAEDLINEALRMAR